MPFLLTLFIFKKLNYNVSFVMLNLLFMTKSYVEISGHTGKKLYQVGSFRQFISKIMIYIIQVAIVIIENVLAYGINYFPLTGSDDLHLSSYFFIVSSS